MLSGRITAGRARLAVVADVRLVVWVVRIAVALDGVGTGAVVIAGRKVAKVMVGDGLSSLGVGCGAFQVERGCGEGGCA
jgi:hypothetical protein